MPAQGLSDLAQQYYIVAPEVPIPERTLVLKQDEIFGVFNEFGDIDTNARQDEGLYYQGTRYLSHLSLSLAGGRPLLLSAGARRDNLLISADLTNPDLYVRGHVMVPRGSIHIFRTKLVWRGSCYERIHVRNFTREPLEVALAIGYAADFQDIFEVRGQRRAGRGRMLDAQIGEDYVELGYEGLDRVTRRTRIECRPAPQHITPKEMQMAVRLPARQEQVFSVTISCSGTEPSVRAASFDAARIQSERAIEAGERFVNLVETSNDHLNAWMQRSGADLNMLLTHTPHGLYPYAGVPWFDTPFGRDGIITALECLWLSPQIAQGVLAFLAATQATEVDPERDAEPGKILHEARSGEMAALKEVPFGRYYGSVDATPLFVVLAGAYYQRTGNLAFVESIWPNVTAALEWMDRYGDADHDGFIEYHRHSPNGLIQQGWKDSHDSVFHADGRLAQGPISLCEVQSYAYAARLAGAMLADALGDHTTASNLRQAALVLRERFQKAFWCEDIGVYALALDGEKKPCRVRSSNTGHCLFSGIAAPEHAQSIVSLLQESTFFSGWGVRTIAENELRYNPMGYHNGSVWPHDNAIIAAGVTTFPDKSLATRILAAQLDASTFFDASRLPELFCGFRRRDGKAPTSYPVACSPQAWAAGAVFMMIQACLGLTIDAPHSRVMLRSPCLPPGVDHITVRGLVVGEASVDVTVHRYRGTVSAHVERRTGHLDIVMMT
ncbi:MAG: amylo-alpha-1,6-glucosidase [Steroidobacteraceae bacterium]|nr:amylo-alpha-1,6-glucosidase [Steroidobacteraceae bacterium]